MKKRERERDDSKIFLERTLQLLRIHIRTLSFDDLALFVDDKLGEIPFYEVTKKAALFFFQIWPKRMRVISVHVDFFKQIEFYL